MQNTCAKEHDFGCRPSKIACLDMVERKRFGILQGTFQNKLIFSDNLKALKILCNDPFVKGKIKLIYIDPPFSTNQVFRCGSSRTSTISRSNSDEIAYVDKFIDINYIEFLRERLGLLRELLANDGSIYVHIDAKMGHYVKVLLDDVFGLDNFINEITRIKCNPKNFSRKGFGNIKDTVFFYSKTKNYLWNDSREDFSRKDIETLFTKINREGRRYTTTPLHAPGETVHGPTGREWRGMKPPKGRHWRYSPDELDVLDGKGLIEWSINGNPRKIIYADEFLKKGKKRQDIWEYKDSPHPSYPTEKNAAMLKVIVEASSNKNDIVLDCFSGSGSTLIAANELNRKWIGIDCSGAAIETSMNRLAQQQADFSYYEVTPH